MSVRYLSLFSGIEAASVAWGPLGWEPMGFSEIDKFASAVLAHHYPDVPNLGDVEKYREWKIEPGSIDLIVGGSPCQSFSIAGLRAGLDDPRGNLALVFLGVVDRFKPRWVVWENVPGVRSSWSDEATFDPSEESTRLLRKNGLDPGDFEEVEQSSDFDCFLSGLAELGYGCFMRSLDAQYFGVAQRRERVFVVGYLGDWRASCAVLLEPESLRWDSAPSRATGEGVAHDVAGCLGGGGERGWSNDLDCSGAFIPEVAKTLSGGKKTAGLNDENRAGAFIPEVACFGGNNTSGPIDKATAVNAHDGPSGRMNFESETFVAHSLRADGFDASEDGTGRGTPIVPVAFGWNKSESQTLNISETTDALQGSPTSNPAVAFEGGVASRDGGHVYEEISGTIRSEPGDNRMSVVKNMQVRRLTPTECARLQGFPDNYLAQVTYNKRCPPADGPMYRAFGNSMAVPVMAWIGRRISLFEQLKGALEDRQGETKGDQP